MPANLSDNPVPAVALPRELELLRALVETLPDPFFCKDREGRFLLTNRANAATFGLRPEDFIGKTDRDLPGVCHNAEIYRAADERVLCTGQPLLNHEEPFRRPDGQIGTYLTSKFPLRDATGAIIGLLGIARDITAEKQERAELELARQRVFDHVQNSPLAVIEWDANLKVERWAGRAEAMFGWSAQEIVGSHLYDWPFVHPEDNEQVKVVCQRLIDGRDSHNVSTNRNLSKTGGTLHCVWHNSILRDDAGKVITILSLVQDVTEQVRAEETARRAQNEKSSIERKLQEAQKLESLGVLAGGIAHDFNNLLTSVLGHASLLRGEMPKTAPEQGSLEQIETAALRAADLCKQMLAYAGKARFDVRILDINAIAEETTRLLHVSVSKHVALVFDFAPGLPAVSADAMQFRQVLMNLVSNASEAIGAREGRISVRTGVARIEPGSDLPEMRGTPELIPGDYVFLEVEDNGPGMTPEVQARVFDPFFTTKFTGRGLGLAAVLGIVRGHRGAMTVRSMPGGGSRFRVLLPQVVGPVPAKVVVPPPPEPELPDGARILVIDDEKSVCLSAQRMLEFLGHRVEVATDGQSGLALYAAKPSTFHLVLLDLTMPHPDGIETLRLLRQQHPDARVLMMSGYSEQEFYRRSGLEPSTGFIQKPFRVDDLRLAINRSLAG